MFIPVDYTLQSAFTFCLPLSQNNTTSSMEMHWGNTSQDGFIQLTQYTKKELVLPAWAAFLEEQGGAGIDKKVLKKKFCLEKRPEKIVNDVMAHACKEDWTFMISTGKIGVYRDATNKEIEPHLCKKVRNMLSGKVFSVQDGNTKNAASSIENSQQQNTNASHNRATVDTAHSEESVPDAMAASSFKNSQQQNMNASQNKATVDTAHSEESVPDAMAGVATTDLGSDNNDNDGYRRVPSENDKVGMDCTSRSQKRPNNTQQQGRDDGSKISCLESIMERVACMESIMEHDSTSRKRCKRFSGKPSSWTHEAKGEGEPAETTFEMVPAQHDAAGAGVPAQPFRLWYECLQCHSFQEITTHHPMDRCYQDGSRDNSGETWKCHGFCKDFTYI